MSDRFLLFAASLAAVLHHNKKAFSVTLFVMDIFASRSRFVMYVQYDAAKALKLELQLVPLNLVDVHQMILKVILLLKPLITQTYANKNQPIELI
uniref:Putative secreted protein n=1 Tax=Anopheles marajoara TaxID=58244 RepID=A0A2M4C989_9DIPT